MKPLTTALSFLILAAAFGFQTQIMHAADTEEALKEEQRLEPQLYHLGFEDSPDCCFSYASRIRCSNFIYYFPTSGGCIMPGIIFVNKKGKQVCANPSDPNVQKCITSLRQKS